MDLAAVPYLCLTSHGGTQHPRFMTVVFFYLALGGNEM